MNDSVKGEGPISSGHLDIRYEPEFGFARERTRSQKKKKKERENRVGRRPEEGGEREREIVKESSQSLW